METTTAQDKWQKISREIGERQETHERVVRFSRRLLVSAALFLLIVGVCGAL